MLKHPKNKLPHTDLLREVDLNKITRCFLADVDSCLPQQPNQAEKILIKSIPIILHRYDNVINDEEQISHHEVRVVTGLVFRVIRVQLLEDKLRKDKAINTIESGKIPHLKPNIFNIRFEKDRIPDSFDQLDPELRRTYFEIRSHNFHILVINEDKLSIFIVTDAANRHNQVKQLLIVAGLYLVFFLQFYQAFLVLFLATELVGCCWG